MLVYFLDLSVPVNSYWGAFVLDSDQVSFIFSYVLSGALKCLELCGFMHSRRPCVGSSFFSSITEDALPP